MPLPPRRSRRLRAWLLLIVPALMLIAAPLARAGTAPVLAGAVSSASDLSGADAVAVSGNYAYTTAYNAGELTAVDISNPSAPTVAGESAYSSNLVAGSNVTVAGGYAFVVSKNRNASAQSSGTACDGTGSNDDGTGNSLTILDIHTDPAHPTIVGTPIRSSTKLFGAYGVAVSGNYAYVAYQGLLTGQPCIPDTSKGGFTVIDISNPAGPQIVGNVDNASLGTCCGGALNHATSVALSGHYAFTNSFNNGDLTVIDISNPAQPTVVKRLVDPNLTFVADLGIEGNYLYAADQAGSSHPNFSVVDISNPLSPQIVATLTNASLLAGDYRIRVSGDFAYLAASSAATVAAIDISNPLAPRIAGSYTDTTNLHSTTGIDLSSDGQYAVAVSPLLSTETSTKYPPYPTSGGPTNTGTLTVVQLDPKPIGVAIGAGPPSQTTQTSAGFSFAADDDVSTVRCQLDGGPLGLCSSPTSQTYSGLTPGPHTFTVQAIDSAGRTATASYPWAVDTAPSNTSSPGIAGTAAQGQTLTASPGGWSGYPAPSYSYQWERCGQSGTGCTAIAGATLATYTLVRPDIGARIAVAVTASNGTGSPQTATSLPTGVITGAPVNTTAHLVNTTGRPVNVRAPGISGLAVQGSRLTLTAGSWTGYPAPSLSYRWLRCNRSGQSCAAISRATASTYTLGAADVGATLRAEVDASNSAGTLGAQSLASGRVVAGAAARASFTIKGGAATLRLSVKAAAGAPAFTRVSIALPAGIRFSSRKSLAHGGLRVAGANGRPVRLIFSLHGGRLLVLQLRRGARQISITLGGRALALGGSLVRRTGHHAPVRITLTVSVPRGPVARQVIKTRVRVR